MMLSVVLTFLVPDASAPIQLIFIFVTYNLFNTIFYTIVGAAAASLPSYAADDPTDRSQMLAYSMLFAAAMQVIVASRIIPISDQIHLYHSDRKVESDLRDGFVSGEALPAEHNGDIW